MPQDPDRPTSNPLLPQSEAFADFKNSSMISAQELLENVAQQVPNFGTEQVCFLITVLVSIFTSSVFILCDCHCGAGNFLLFFETVFYNCSSFPFFKDIVIPIGF